MKIMSDKEFKEICKIIETEFDCIIDINTEWIDDEESYIYIKNINVDDREDSSQLGNTTSINKKLSKYNLLPLIFNRDDAYPDGTSTYTLYLKKI